MSMDSDNSNRRINEPQRFDETDSSIESVDLSDTSSGDDWIDTKWNLSSGTWNISKLRTIRNKGIDWKA